jgi:ribosomal protein S18 acetylase RimI-like enzyme
MELRPYRDGDEDPIVGLWNRRVSGCFATGPLTAEVFRADVVGKTYFEPEGLILAFQGPELAAFVHAGFRSLDWIRPDFTTGTVSMVAAENGALEAGMPALAQAVRYLLRRGARQVEAFTIDFPNTPFYNGLYGGEKAGMDEEHPLGLELMSRGHFKVSNGAMIMLCELQAPETVSAAPEGLELRVGPWDCPLTGRRPNECYGIPEDVRRASLRDAAGAEKAGITFWRLDRHNRATGDRLAVVSHVGCAAELRGTGAAPFLQRSVHRILWEEGARHVGLGAGARNGRAIGFYRKLGYRPLKVAYSFFLDWRLYEDYR